MEQKNIERQSFHSLLKTATSSLHSRLEEINPLASTIPTIENYIKFLTATYRILLPLEIKVNKIKNCDKNELLSKIYSSKIPQIENDLKSLNIEISSCKNSIFIPEINNLPELLGAIYVIEGSALGGQMISKRMIQTHGEKIKSSLTYLMGHGPKTFPIWKEFINKLENYAENNSEKQQLIIEIAVKMFLCFEKEFLSN